MLGVLRLSSLDELFAHLPSAVRLKEPYRLERPFSDGEVRTAFKQMTGQPLLSLRGFGAYDHDRPAIVDALASRQEFLTSYTPYQPEVAQGTLQYIFEYQTMICELTGMDVSNASMYDGATAAAEAMMMAVNQTGRSRFIASEGLLPHVLETLNTYAHFRGVELITVPVNDSGIVTQAKLIQALETPSAGFLVGYPNRYGIVTPLKEFTPLVHQGGALFVVYADLLALNVFATPAQAEADIVCGEAQTLGIPLSFGGPYLGYLATVNRYVRKMPGRICGMTKDNRGQRAYVLTLQAREQHIRREKANSNICSNQSLMALQATIYAATLGRAGLREVAVNAIKATHYLAERLIATKNFAPTYPSAYGYEVTLTYKKNIFELNKRLEAKGYLGAMPLDDHRGVFYASEKMTKALLDAFINAVEVADREIR
jgi:glycine dehydrogenase subunit 1